MSHLHLIIQCVESSCKCPHALLDYFVKELIGEGLPQTEDAHYTHLNPLGNRLFQTFALFTEIVNSSMNSTTWRRVPDLGAGLSRAREERIIRSIYWLARINFH